MKYDADLKQARRLALALIAVNVIWAAFLVVHREYYSAVSMLIWGVACWAWLFVIRVQQATREETRRLLAMTLAAIEEEQR